GPLRWPDFALPQNPRAPAGLAADRPGRRAASLQQQRRAPVLLGLRRRRRIAAAAHGPPRSVGELVLAPERAAAADRARIALRLAERDSLEQRAQAGRNPGAVRTQLRAD